MDPITAGALVGGTGLIGTFLQNQAASANAQRQMDFQREMSNTAHTREVQDLRNAGLNPILSASGSGASTPSGAAAPVSDFAPAISKGFETAMAVRAQNKQFQQQDTAIDNLSADTDNKKMSNSLIANQTSASAADVKTKNLTNNILEKTLNAQIKKAQAEGDYAEINQLMGVLQSGTSSANNLLGGKIGDIIKHLTTPLPRAK